MRRLSIILATALVATTAGPPPAMADKKSDAVVAGAIIGALIVGAAAAAKNRDNNRYNYATDKIFFPADLPGVMCYARARQCYLRGHYSVWATREVFQ
jgi:streptogramin lyase